MSLCSRVLCYKPGRTSSAIEPEQLLLEPGQLSGAEFLCLGALHGIFNLDHAKEAAGSACTTTRPSSAEFS